MARQPRTAFTDEFKKSAVKLAEKLGSQKLAAEELGVSEVNMHNWVKKFGGVVVPKATKKAVEPRSTKSVYSSEVESLRAENAELRSKVKLLRQLVAVLSQDFVKNI